MTEEEQIELALRMSLAENEEKEEENNDDMKEWKTLFSAQK